MPLNPKLLKVLDKIYEPQERYDQTILGKAITFIKNEQGEPVTLFIGKRREDGSIAGERYVRSIVRVPGSLEIQKSHWESKGKVTRS